MSNSTKRRPISGMTTARSEKQDKRIANRRERRINKTVLTTTHDETKLRAKREVSNVWSMDKDGKVRFDPSRHPKLMRK